MATGISDILGECVTTTDLGRIRFLISVSISISLDSVPSMIPNSNDFSREMVGKLLANSNSQYIIMNSVQTACKAISFKLLLLFLLDFKSRQRSKFGAQTVRNVEK